VDNLRGFIVSALIVIPARLKSTRFPAKCLMRQTGKYLIEHVYEQAAKSKRAGGIVVATDDMQIFQAVHSFGGHVVMTRPNHLSGTDRIAEVAALPAYAAFTSIVNVQGDEPEIDPAMIDDLIRLLEATDVQMVTAAAPFQSRAEISNPNVVKVVIDQRRFALYFSRSVIPHDRDGVTQNAGSLELAGLYRKHLGVYAYRRNFLLLLTQTPPCELEKLEQLEQLRALYLGAKILVHDVPTAHHGIDTPEDYAAFVNRMAAPA
jgi:3-deoxy-manno-octulosonate cytidylyltransferase (CMP-KDO synthetase)